jgi:hypothetical protein
MNQENSKEGQDLNLETTKPSSFFMDSWLPD